MDAQGKLTVRGKELRAEALSGGAALTFLRAAAGSGETGSAATELTNEQQALTLGSPRVTGSSILLPATLVAAQAAADYLLTEVGLYVKDGDSEVLYCVYHLSTALPITAGTDLSVRFDLEEVIDDEPIVAVSPAGIVTEGDLLALMGAANGLATLDEDGDVPDTQLPEMNYAPAYTYGTDDLTAGVSPLQNGRLHFVYV